MSVQLRHKEREDSWSKKDLREFQHGSYVQMNILDLSMDTRGMPPPILKPIFCSL